MAYGSLLLRSFPRIQVYRGFDPMNPTGLTQTARVKAGVTILSGQAIVLEYNATDSVYEWNLATLTTARAGNVYFAYQDSTDMDVRDGGLTGLSSSGQYEIQTAFFDTANDEDYEVDVMLTLTDDADLKGYLVPVPAPALADATFPVVGRVTRYKSPRLLQNASAGIKDDSSTTAANSGVIVFQTGNFGSVTVPAA